MFASSPTLDKWSSSSFVADCTRRARDYNQSSIARNHISLALSASTPDSATSNIWFIMYTVQTGPLDKFWFTFLPVLFWFSMVVSNNFLWFDFDLMVREMKVWVYSLLSNGVLFCVMSLHQFGDNFGFVFCSPVLFRLLSTIFAIK